MIKDTNITIMIKDMERSISFYQSIGFEVKNRWDNHYAQLAAPGIAIGLHPTNEKNLSQAQGNLSIGFVTDDFEHVKSSLAQLAIATMLRQEAGGQFIHFTDPDGTLLYFIKPK